MTTRGRVLSLFVTSQCYVVHNDSGICKIISPLFCFLVNSHLGIKVQYTKGTRHFNSLEDYRFVHHWFSGVNTP